VLVATIATCYFIEIFVLPQMHPSFREMGWAMITPHFRQSGMLYVAIGIIGATVMPHNKPALTIETHPAQRFGRDTLDRVAMLVAAADGVLSAYLDVEPSETQREGFEAALLDLWKPLRAAFVDSDMTGRLEEEIGRVNDFVRSWIEPPGRSVAIFSLAPRDVFVPVALDVPVLAGARFGPLPYLLPLIAALDEHERCCVALVDRERARILTVWMGAVETRSEFEDPLPGRVTRGGGWSTRGRDRPLTGAGLVHSSQGGYARHIDYHVHLHMQRVVAELWRLTRQQAVGRIVIGGPPEARSALRRMLPRSLAERVAGEFAGELFASDADVLDRVRGIEEQAEREHESALVSEVVERANKAQLAVTGWDDTLTALCDGSVHELLLVEGLTTIGYVCPEGHFAAIERVDVCPYCDEPVWRSDDLTAWAARRAFATDANVELVRGTAAEALRPHGAAAVLRY